jgi:hypothetical protein
MHPHFYNTARSSHVALRDALRRANLQGVSSFEDLRQRVGRALRGIPLVAEKRDGLRVYDISLRLGASLGLKPDRVYCYAGAAQGARALGLRDEIIDPARFPPAFRSLEPLEIEDLLCVLSEHLTAASLHR